MALCMLQSTGCYLLAHHSIHHHHRRPPAAPADSPSEDILCILYDTFEFIDRARCGAAAAAAALTAPHGSGAQPPDARQDQRLDTGDSASGAPMDITRAPSSSGAAPAPCGSREAACSSGGGGGGGGRVLVHCSQGVSRSTTIAIAYLMWKLGQPYEEVYQVRALGLERGGTAPDVCGDRQQQCHREEIQSGKRSAFT